MLGKTHRIGGACMGITIATTMYGTNNINVNKMAMGVIITSSILGSLLPDIDSKTSTISHKFPIISKLVRKLSNHRGIMHTFVPYIMCFLILLLPVYAFSKVISMNGFSLFGYYILLNLGIFIGVTSHLILDMLTPSGVPILYPFTNKKISIGKLNGAKHGWIVSIFMICITIVILFAHYNNQNDITISIFDYIKVELSHFKNIYNKNLIQMN